jgi:hypothetical protein
MTKLNSILPLLSQLTLEELRSLNSIVVATIKSNSTLESRLVGAQLKVGDMVTCNHPKVVGSKLRVTKISRTKASVRDEGSGRSYNIPMNMLILSK